ncbi:hypothetical protein T492DRAFT_182275 [Pavlovales sp. CCMP2436]|nr:hypothetical protein T492DRAFT_182275 [Pavlovales sp. CCMP2436]
MVKVLSQQVEQPPLLTFCFYIINVYLPAFIILPRAHTHACTHTHMYNDNNLMPLPLPLPYLSLRCARVRPTAKHCSSVRSRQGRPSWGPSRNCSSRVRSASELRGCFAHSRASPPLACPRWANLAESRNGFQRQGVSSLGTSAPQRQSN